MLLNTTDLFQVLQGYHFMNGHVPLFAPLCTKVENC